MSAIVELLKEANVNYRLTAIDINTTANVIYRHNHIKSNDDRERVQLLERNIQGFSADALDRLQIHLLTMSPPCQPFSR